jgi:hypothetical protein
MQLLSQYSGGTYSFIGNDSESLFNDNLKNMPSDWRWRNEKVTYTLNSQGFRCAEFETIDWNNSILVIGDSLGFGMGVDDSQTGAKQLADLTNRSVINLSQTGASAMYLWANTSILVENNIRPICVIYIWPNSSRMVEFISNNRIHHRGIWGDEFENSLGFQWCMHPHQGDQFFKYAIKSVTTMWRCNVLHYTWSKPEATMCNISHLHSEDTGRDHRYDPLLKRYTAHAGPDTYQVWAQLFKKDLYNIYNIV